LIYITANRKVTHFRENEKEVIHLGGKASLALAGNGAESIIIIIIIIIINFIYRGLNS